MEQPILRLGLLGFDTHASCMLHRWTERQAPGWPNWQIGDPHHADAWLIDGRSVDVLGRDALRIQHPAGSRERLSLHRAEVDRPLAFALPLPEGFASAESFDAADEQGFRLRLQRFEAWLRPLRSQFALGEQLAGRLAEFRREVVHLMHEGRLVAIIDFPRWQCGLLLPARPVDLANAQWVRRPPMANDIPASFLRLRLHHVLWAYAVRTQRDLLPPRYRDRVLFVRRIPHLPPRWLEPLHREILQALSIEPCTLAQLRARTGRDDIELARRLAALYYAASLTTDEDCAQRVASRVRQDMLALSLGARDHGVSSVSRQVSQPDLMVPSSILRTPLSPLSRVEGESQGHNVGIKTNRGTSLKE